jgi:hypothetical protein
MKDPRQLHLVAPFDEGAPGTERRIACLTGRHVADHYPNAEARLMWRDAVRAIDQRRTAGLAIREILWTFPAINDELVRQLEQE